MSDSYKPGAQSSFWHTYLTECCVNSNGGGGGGDGDESFISVSVLQRNRIKRIHIWRKRLISRNWLMRLWELESLKSVGQATRKHKRVRAAVLCPESIEGIFMLNAYVDIHFGLKICVCVVLTQG